MLREFENVRQIEGEGPRRWFGDEDMDLIVWYDAGDPDRVVGFQLCYDKRTTEHAVTWRPAGRASHHRVDAGEGDPKANRSPILLADGPLPLARLLEGFRARSEGIDPAVRALVLDGLAGLDPTLVP